MLHLHIRTVINYVSKLHTKLPIVTFDSEMYVFQALCRCFTLHIDFAQKVC